MTTLQHQRQRALMQKLRLSYPDTHIAFEFCDDYFSCGNHTASYRVYIRDEIRIGQNGWTPDFKTLGGLITYLNSRLWKDI